MICVLGDAHLDVVVAVRGPLAEEADTEARIVAGAGGQAANVAAWVAALGGRARLRDAALAAAAQAPRLSVDLSATSALRGYGVGRFRELMGRLGPDLVFGNEAEADLAGDLPGAEVIVKLGDCGVLAGGRRYPALPVTPADSTGAGDAFAAGYLVGGVALGLEAAAWAVAKMGAMP